jgi:hypothetical protein
MMELTIYAFRMDGEGEGPAPFHGYRYRTELDDDRTRAVVRLMEAMDDTYELIDGPCHRYEIHGGTEDILRPLLEAAGITPDFGLLPGLTRRSEIVVELVD